MTSANVQLVRAIYADWERGDHSSADWAHPEIEYVGVDGLNPGTAKGLAAMAEAFRNWLSAWENWRVAAEEYVELDAERVFVPYNFTARGKTSGVEVDEMWSKGANVFHIRDGKVFRLDQYLDREHALADLGLAPEADSP
jgi:ketosteroid isomerase-like protein